MAQAAVSMWTGVMEKFWPKDSTARSAGTAGHGLLAVEQGGGLAGEVDAGGGGHAEGLPVFAEGLGPRSWPIWIIQGLQEL